MSRRFAITTFIVMSSILIIFFLYVLILFLLPGVSLLGIKYIALNTHSLDSKKLIISDMKDSNGNTVLTHEPELDFAVVILSSPDIQKGQTYTITVGTSTSSFEAN